MASRCRKCGLPKYLLKRITWTSRGEICSIPGGGERLFFLDSSWIRLLVEEARKEGGEELLKRLREIRREHTRSRVEAAVRGWGSFLLRRRLTGRKMLQEMLDELPRYGYGRLEILEYRPRKTARFKANNPCDDLFLTADLWGLWEATQEVRASAHIEKLSGGALTLTLESEGKAKRPEKSFEGQRGAVPASVRKDDVIPLCSRCRKPVYPGKMNWDEEEGIITDEGSGRRFIITPVASWAKLLFLLKREHPGAYQSFTERLAEGQKAFAGDGKTKDLKTAYRDYFLSLPFLGWGKPTRVIRKPFLIDAELLGAPFPELLAACMRGRFGSLEGEDWTVEVMASGDSRHRFIMGPRINGPWQALESLRIPASHPGIILPG